MMRSRQQGVALVVSLLLLLAITLVAVSNMRRTTVQERMTGNLYDSQLVMQQAEAALLFAERRLENAALPAGPVGLIGQPGIYNLPNPLAADRWAPGNNSQWQPGPAMNDAMVVQAQYIIEYMGDWAYPPDCDRSLTIPANCLQPTFRITARVPANDGRAETMLQTVWRR
ncbi:MAG: PilX N-terminal domain-containing pilus assembly protein [Alishewanella aestuarii]